MDEQKRLDNLRKKLEEYDGFRGDISDYIGTVVMIQRINARKRTNPEVSADLFVLRGYSRIHGYIDGHSSMSASRRFSNLGLKLEDVARVVASDGKVIYEDESVIGEWNDLFVEAHRGRKRYGGILGDIHEKLAAFGLLVNR